MRHRVHTAARRLPADVLFAALVMLASCAVAAAEDSELFDAGSAGDVLDLVDSADRDAFAASLEDAGRNWNELADAVRRLEGDERDSCVWLINGMPHLDRLEMTSETLVEHVTYAYRTRTEMPYPVPDDMFGPYILTYRIEEEPVDPWRRELFERFAEVAVREGSVENTARALNAELANAVEERDREFFGPRQSPMFTLRSGRGTKTEISILACAAMKAVGIPSREAGVPALGSEEGAASWIEVFNGEDWLPLYPLEPESFADFSHTEREHWRNVTIVVTRSAFERLLVTEDYTETGEIRLSFVGEGEPASGFEHFAISVLNNGELKPLDALEAVADEEGLFTATVGNGTYVVQAGIRDEKGNPFVMMKTVTITPGAVREFAFDVSAGGRGRSFTPEELVRYETSVAGWVAFDLEGEPSLRMLPLIESAFERYGVAVEVTYAYMGRDPDNADDARNVLGPDAVIKTVRDEDMWYYVDEHGDRHVIGESGVGLPVVRVYARHGGDVILHSEGYDLNIERRIVAGVDRYLEGLLNRRRGAGRGKGTEEQ